MNATDAYGDECPFCKTTVPLEAVVCTGCHAKKGHRFDTMGPTDQWARLFVWCSSVGFALWVTFLAWSRWQKDHALAAFGIALAVTAVTYVVHRVYRKILGTVMDPIWVRKG